MASVLVPVLYLAILVGSLLVFSNFYRKRVAARLAENPWFPSHPDRDTYVTLLQQRDPPAPEVVLKAALLRRAVGDVHRILRIKEDKGALNNLVQRGAVGDDLWTRFLATEKELEAEIVEVMSEANSFREGWGQIIFQTASEIVNNEKTREQYGNLNRAKTIRKRAPPLDLPSPRRPQALALALLLLPLLAPQCSFRTAAHPSGPTLLVLLHPHLPPRRAMPRHPPRPEHPQVVWLAGKPRSESSPCTYTPYLCYFFIADCPKPPCSPSCPRLRIPLITETEQTFNHCTGAHERRNNERTTA
ncbi:Pre protein translocase subunit Sec66-domain-containing protein [Auriculariales sp. MPI-PUGE-AT-0066]|nr:Pre protein translocase subunit Sec66-domain-containing protein [Auriculariales sp. MPI-PUGE-AT-0066]